MHAINEILLVHGPSHVITGWAKVNYCGKSELNRKTCFAKKFPYTKFSVHSINEIYCMFTGQSLKLRDGSNLINAIDLN